MTRSPIGYCGACDEPIYEIRSVENGMWLWELTAGRWYVCGECGVRWQA